MMLPYLCMLAGGALFLASQFIGLKEEESPRRTRFGKVVSAIPLLAYFYRREEDNRAADFEAGELACAKRITQEDALLVAFKIPVPAISAVAKLSISISEDIGRIDSFDPPRFTFPPHRYFPVLPTTGFFVSGADQRTIDEAEALSRSVGLHEVVKRFPGRWLNRDPYAFYRGLRSDSLVTAKRSFESAIVPLATLSAIDPGELFETFSLRAHVANERRGPGWNAINYLAKAVHPPLRMPQLPPDAVYFRILPDSHRPTAAGSFFETLRNLNAPFAFNIVYRQGTVAFLIACPPQVSDRIHGQLVAAFPESEVEPCEPPQLPAMETTELYPHASLGSFHTLRRLQAYDPYRLLFQTLAEAPDDAAARIEVACAPVGHGFLAALNPPGDIDDVNELRAKFPGWLVRLRVGSTDSKLYASICKQWLAQYESETRSFQPSGPPGRLYGHWGIYSTEELTALAHFSVDSEIVERAGRNRNEPPTEALQPTGLLVGTATYKRQQVEARLPQHVRNRHVYVVGASGSGKSTLLLNFIKQDIEAGAGLAVIDPHGDLVADALAFVPPWRLADTAFIDMADLDCPVSLNPFAVEPHERAQAADEFVLVFERMFLQDAARAKHILYFTIACLLEAGNTTPLDIETFLTSPAFREQVLGRLRTERFVRFVAEEFRKYEGAVDPIVNKLARFGVKPEVSALLGQSSSKLNIYDAMQHKKILLLKLMPERQEDSQLIGGLFVSQVQLAAMRRTQIPPHARTPFTLYVDEFQHFMSGGADAFAKILSEARKYELCLVLAHQFTSQLAPAVADAIFGNVHTTVTFRVSADDAGYLQKTVATYSAADLQSLRRGEAVLKIGTPHDSFTVTTFDKPPKPAVDMTAAVVESSRRNYGTPPRPAAPPELPPEAPPMAQQPPAAPAAPAAEALPKPKRTRGRPKKAAVEKHNPFADLLGGT